LVEVVVRRGKMTLASSSWGEKVITPKKCSNFFNFFFKYIRNLK